MSVLPASTTLYSFFIVLFALLLLTISMGLFISPVLSVTKQASSQLVTQSNRFAHCVVPTTYFHSTLVPLLDPFTPLRTTNNYDPQRFVKSSPFPFLLRTTRYLLRDFQAELVHNYLLRAIIYPGKFWSMLRFFDNRFVRFSWHPKIFVWDVLLLLFWPFAILLVPLLVIYIVLLDFVVYLARACLQGLGFKRCSRRC